MLSILYFSFVCFFFLPLMGRPGRDRVVVGFTATGAISAYQH